MITKHKSHSISNQYVTPENTKSALHRRSTTSNKIYFVQLKEDGQLKQPQRRPKHDQTIVLRNQVDQCSPIESPLTPQMHLLAGAYENYKKNKLKLLHVQVENGSSQNFQSSPVKTFSDQEQKIRMRSDSKKCCF